MWLAEVVVPKRNGEKDEDGVKKCGETVVWIDELIVRLVLVEDCWVVVS